MEHMGAGEKKKGERKKKRFALRRVLSFSPTVAFVFYDMCRKQACGKNWLDFSDRIDYSRRE